jgi:hypothetical protein
MADLSDKLFALGLAENVDTCVQGSDSDCVCSGRDAVLVVHGAHDVLYYCRAVIVEYLGSA